MTAQAQPAGFLKGLLYGGLTGVIAALAAVLLLGVNSGEALFAQATPYLRQLWQLASFNLQGSIVPFIAVLLAYWVQLQHLRQRLAAPEPDLALIVRHEQLLDLCANLFFGIGVIWTAIGMRDALLHALGDPGITASEGAFAILQRLVDGGILLALSTTIVGGMGGYLMRAIKSVSLGHQINLVYMRAHEQPATDNLAALRRIETLLDDAPVSREREAS